jgi:hypothetical protein
VPSAAGGLGLLIGDRQLNYSNGRIFEAYYAYAIHRNFTFTADYQLITNPAYNADRGLVSIFSGRLHGEFCTRRLLWPFTTFGRQRWDVRCGPTSGTWWLWFS